MIEYECVRPEGCISEPCSDISTNWIDMRSGFGYIILSAIGLTRGGEEDEKRKS